MSKRLLVFIYVLAVLIFSGFIANARTVQESVNVDMVKIDQRKGVLSLTGRLPNPCFTKPVVVIEKTDEERAEIFLSVVATSTAPVCIQVLGSTYKATMDLNELTLRRGKEYSFIINNYSGSRLRITFTAIQSGPNHINFEEHIFNGVLATNNGQNFVIIKDGLSIPVISPALELQAYLNKEIWIKGFAFPYGSKSALLPISISSIN